MTVLHTLMAKDRQNHSQHLIIKTTQTTLQWSKIHTTKKINSNASSTTPSTSNSKATNTPHQSLSNSDRKRYYNAITPAKFYRDMFAEMLIIDPTEKMITNDEETYAHSKELPLGKDCASEFTTAIVINSKFNSIKSYVYCNIETEIPLQWRWSYRSFTKTTCG